MNYHILNGDALVEVFPSNIEGEKIIIREAFVEGPVRAKPDVDLLEERSAFIQITYEATAGDYEEQFLSQVKKLDTITDDDTVCLWFEDDLFCVVNMLFAVAYITEKANPAFVRVFPAPDNKFWKGFGRATEGDLNNYYLNSYNMEKDDVELCRQLWEAYAKYDRDRLRALSFSETSAFHFLPEVIEAHLQRTSTDELPGRPQAALIRIIQRGITNFYEIFEEFWRTEGVYGFGDAQVLTLLKEMEIEFSEDL